MKNLTVRALLIEPLNDVRFIDYDIKQAHSNEEIVTWETTSVCNSERRRYSLTKSHNDRKSFIGGHEAVGFIETDQYIKRRYALLPHSNCITRGDTIVCEYCRSNQENLCKNMSHAGLDKNTPSGFCEKNVVQKSQLFDVTELNNKLAPFLEPLSCVIRSWSLAKINFKMSSSINIIGGGPIGCLHAFYLNKANRNNNIFIIESSKERRLALEIVFNEFENIKIVDDGYKNKSLISVMAASSSSSYKKAKLLTKKDGTLILFSGFDQNNFKGGKIDPEIIHRKELRFYHEGIFLVGSSGYTKENLIKAKLELLDFNECKNIITGEVNGLESNELIRSDGVIEKFDEPVLINDIKGKLSNHIKIHYHHTA